MTEQNRFVAADWLPTGNGPVITCDGNCVEIGLGLTNHIPIGHAARAMERAGEEVRYGIHLEAIDGEIRVFLRFGGNMPIMGADWKRAQLVHQLAMSFVYRAIVWNDLARKRWTDEEEGFREADEAALNMSDDAKAQCELISLYGGL